MMSGEQPPAMPSGIAHINSMPSKFLISLNGKLANNSKFRSQKLPSKVIRAYSGGLLAADGALIPAAGTDMHQIPERIRQARHA